VLFVLWFWFHRGRRLVFKIVRKDKRGPRTGRQRRRRAFWALRRDSILLTKKQQGGSLRLRMGRDILPICAHQELTLCISRASALLFARELGLWLALSSPDHPRKSDDAFCERRDISIGSFSANKFILFQSRYNILITGG
jgi:hypothetical protein